MNNSLKYSLTSTKKENIIPIEFINYDNFYNFFENQNTLTKQWITNFDFIADEHSYCIIYNKDGIEKKILIGIGNKIIKNINLFSLGFSKNYLKNNFIYKFINIDSSKIIKILTLNWMLDGYYFDKYQNNINISINPKLFIPSNIKNYVYNISSSISLTRDLINTPANEMMPQHIFKVIYDISKKYNAQCSQIVGDELDNNNFSTINIVGKGSINQPRLIELLWGNQSNPLITLVGKGVCFDSGGLNIKSTNKIRYMKKDMGGAAHVIGLANMIMSTKLPIRLRLLVPAVENSISNNSYRPGDIIKTRAGINIEVDNTDAEGRIILSEVLYDACNEKPELVVDFATLTGAARYALGSELPAFYSNNDKIADSLQNISKLNDDPIWQMPLYEEYKPLIKSDIAHIVNSYTLNSIPMGGSITAALFLEYFIHNNVNWVHFDITGWNFHTKPSRPKGGEAQGIRVVYDYLKSTYT